MQSIHLKIKIRLASRAATDISDKWLIFLYRPKPIAFSGWWPINTWLDARQPTRIHQLIHYHQESRSCENTQRESIKRAWLIRPTNDAVTAFWCNHAFTLIACHNIVLSTPFRYAAHLYNSQYTIHTTARSRYDYQIACALIHTAVNQAIRWLWRVLQSKTFTVLNRTMQSHISRHKGRIIVLIIGKLNNRTGLSAHWIYP